MDLMQQLHRLQHAACPEDVFGGEETAVKATYRHLASQTHPDAHPHDPAAADEAFKLLQQWYAEAQRKIAQGCYGQPLRVKVTSANYVYEGSERPFVGDLCHLYPSYAASQPVLLKMVQHSRNNDLAQAEARVLYQLDQALRGEPLRAHFPTLVESFLLRDSGGAQRQANVLCRESDTVTLADIIAAYPDGIHPADMAWMFNRLLAALAVTHSQGLVHGAVLPPHLLLRPADHNGMLLDWCYSVEIGRPIKAISPPYRSWYPPELLAKQPATPASDLFLAARCMVAVLGGRVAGQEHGIVWGKTAVPRPITALLQSCLIPAPHRRPDNGWELFEALRDMLGQLYGPPQFRPFHI